MVGPDEILVPTEVDASLCAHARIDLSKQGRRNGDMGYSSTIETCREADGVKKDATTYDYDRLTADWRRLSKSQL